jgi:hypothetical protein
VNIAGSYSVYYTDPSGCVSAETLVDVIENPPLNIGTSGNVSICLGDDATLNATGASSYIWDNGLGSGPSITVSPIVNTTYTLTGTDANGCQGQGQVSIVVNALPVVTTNADFAICLGSNASFTALGAASYSWDNNAGTGSNVSVSPSVTTSYTVTGTDLNGCLGTDVITVTVNPLPIVSITPSVLDTLCSDGSDPITLTGTPSGGTFSGPGVMGSVFDPGSAGTGAFTINYVYSDLNGCAGTNYLEAVVLNCSALSENLVESVVLSPNPNNGVFSVSGFSANTDFWILDVRGRVILKGVVQSSENAQFMMDVDNGVYFLYGNAGGGQSVIRIVVNN